MKDPGGLKVDYLGGFSGHSPTLRGGGIWRIRVDVDVLEVLWGSMKGRIDYKWVTVRSEPWDQLIGLSFASAQATSANIPALAMFGVLGLAARREPGTFICVSYSDGDVFFKSSTSTFALQAQLQPVASIPELAQAVSFNGVSLGRQPRVDAEVRRDPTAKSVPQMIRELGELRDTGLISDSEFEAKKAELLSRM